jgi:hypothetical protein
MRETTTMTAEVNPIARLKLTETALGIGLACTSVGAILAHVFAGVPMMFTAPFVVMPTGALLVSAVLMRKRLYGVMHLFASLVALGGGCGLLSTLIYDMVWPLLTIIFQSHYEPYKAISIFGFLITGRPQTDPVALAAGWAYHAWNGINFGMMFSLFRPRGGVIAGMIWGIGLQLLLFATYPHLLKVRLNDPGLMVVGLVGHSVWGAVLGYSVRKWGRHHDEATPQERSG